MQSLLRAFPAAGRLRFVVSAASGVFLWITNVGRHCA